MKHCNSHTETLHWTVDLSPTVASLVYTLCLQDCASKGVRGRLGVVLRAYLDAYLPDNAHELCDGSTFLAVTRGELEPCYPLSLFCTSMGLLLLPV